MKYIVAYVDLMGFEEKANGEARKTGRPIEDIRYSWRSSIEIRLKSEIAVKYCIASLDSWLLYSVDFGSILKTIEDILKTNLTLEIAVDIKESNDTKETMILELMVLNDKTIKFLKGNIIGQYKDWYKKEYCKSPMETFILFTDNEWFDPKPIGSKPYIQARYYLVKQEELKKLITKFDLDIILDSINTNILKNLETQQSIKVVASQEEFSKVVEVIKKNSYNNFYKVDIIPNTLCGFKAGYNLGIYTINDTGGSKVNFSIEKFIRHE